MWNWRRSLRNVHRDLGYACAALTVVYAVSGIAVNHRGDWDYNRSTTVENYRLGRPAVLLRGLEKKRREVLSREPASITSTEEWWLAEQIGQRLGISERPHNTLWRSRHRLAIHFTAGDADEVEYDVRTGRATRTRRSDRAILREMNFLHLNESRRWWTVVADAYAGALLVLAVSGVLMLRGRRGIRGRGGVLLAFGLLVPILALLLAGAL